MSNKCLACVAATVAGLSLQAAAPAAEQVDAPLTDTAQIRTAANNPFLAGQVDVAGVNFFYNNAQNPTNIPGGAAAGTVNGVGFDNIDLDSPQGSPPPSGPFALAQNGGGVTMSAAWTFPLTTSQQDRHQSATFAGPAADAAALAGVAGEFFYLSANQAEHGSVTFTFSGPALAPNQPVYVQVIGGDSGWSGDIAVAANGTGVGTWNDVADGNGATASLYAFDATTDAGGSLAVSLTGVDHFSGVSGIILSTVPEPTAAALLGLAGLGLLARRRRGRQTA